MYFKIPVNMVRSQELVSLLSILTACISLSRCGSFITVTEDEAVQLYFPYPCDSNKVTIQSANRAPFYNSAESESLKLPFYQLNRFSVTDRNCSVQVEINPVKRSDEATYICQAYRDSAIQSVLTRIRLNVNYHPGNLYCTFSFKGPVVGNWLSLKCTAPVGSLARGFYCYQDYIRMPPLSQLVQIDETLTQTIWAKKEYPIFCCSVILHRPRDMCECDDFVWDPSDTEKILNPCPLTTAGQGAISEGPVEKGGDQFFTDSVNPSTSKTFTNNVKSTPILWVGGIAILIMVTVFVIVTLYRCHVKKTNTNALIEKKEGHPETQSFMTKVQECGYQTSQKVPPILSNTDKATSTPSSWGSLRSTDIGGIFPLKGQLKAKSMGTLHL